MDMMMAQCQTLSSIEQRLLAVLHIEGPCTLDRLSILFDMNWAQAFLAVDSLSRSHHAALHRTESREYLVSAATERHTYGARP